MDSTDTPRTVDNRKVQLVGIDNCENDTLAQTPRILEAFQTADTYVFGK